MAIDDHSTNTRSLNARARARRARRIAAVAATIKVFGPSRMAHHIDYSRQYISAVLRGRRDPSVKALREFSHCLNVTLDDLLAYCDDQREQRIADGLKLSRNLRQQSRHLK